VIESFLVSPSDLSVVLAIKSTTPNYFQTAGLDGYSQYQGIVRVSSDSHLVIWAKALNSNVDKDFFEAMAIAISTDNTLAAVVYARLGEEDNYRYSHSRMMIRVVSMEDGSHLKTLFLQSGELGVDIIGKLNNGMLHFNSQGLFIAMEFWS